MNKKTIFVTGAAAGIGRATALKFASQGWRVAATDVDKEGLDKLKKEIGESHYYSTLNVTDKKAVEKVLAEFCGGNGGRLDLLFNNAGILSAGKFEEIGYDRHEAIISVNVKGVMNCLHGALPYLRAASKPYVINMSSLGAVYGVPTEATYSATKFFVRGITEALNIEWEAYGIHVCDVMPNFVNTPMVDNIEGTLKANAGVHIEPHHVADTVWQAAHGKKLHWRVNTPGLSILDKFDFLVPRSVYKIVLKKIAEY